MSGDNDKGAGVQSGLSMKEKIPKQSSPDKANGMPPHEKDKSISRGQKLRSNA